MQVWVRHEEGDKLLDHDIAAAMAIGVIAGLLPPCYPHRSRHWEYLVEEFAFSPEEQFAFSPEEQEVIGSGADRMIAEVRTHRLAEIRRHQHATQVDVAASVGVSQARVSRIEKGQLEPSKLDPLAAYVKGLGGKLKIVADFRG